MGEARPAAGDVFQERFQDLVPAMRSEEAAAEAHRCLYCYDAPCVQACPTHIEIPRFIKQIAARAPMASAKTILEANPMGHSCARACPVEVLCEGACVYLEWHEKPIEIARLQRFATDSFYGAPAANVSPDGPPGRSGSGRGAAGPGSRSEDAWRSGAALDPARRRAFKPGPDNGRKVAVIGAGPAGLSCAFYLRRLGYRVIVYERSPLPGGLNTYGIAEYKLTRSVALEEARLVQDMGAEVIVGVEIGKDLGLEKLEREFEAVFIGIGLGETRALRVPGEGLKGVWDALSFIARIKEREVDGLGLSRITVVIGAGNTAIDAVTQAKRLGAERVLMAYRRGPGEMSAYDYEFELAKSDGIEFLWNAAPIEIIGQESVEGIRFVRTRPGPDKTVENAPGTEFEVPCDRVIKAIGQTRHYSLAKAAGLSLDPTGRILVDPKTLRTSNPRYWAGGDAINGGKEVVNAAGDGKRAAWSMHKALSRVEKPPKEHEYWVSTIEGRKIAPIPHRKIAEAVAASPAGGLGGTGALGGPTQR